jgi:short-subunit dehydrogenase
VRLADAVVLVTGASGAIGAACARALSEREAKVIVHGRDTERLEAVAADVGAKALQVELNAPDAAEELAQAAREVFGRVDAIVHSAGVGWYGPTAAMPGQTMDELIEVNLAAPARMTRILLPEMLARGGGHVSFIASIAGWTGVRNEAMYAATKAAVITFADSLRLELTGSGVGVSVVSPASVRTEFFDRRGEPYGRRFPRQVETGRVAAAVLRGIEHDRAHQMIPRWLAIAPAVRATAPGAFRSLSRRFGQK